MKKLTLFLLLFTINAYAAGKFLEPLPTGAQDVLYSGIYLDVDRVMQDETLTRFEAVEVQNQMRTLIQDRSLAADDAYAQALVKVRAHQYVSGWRPVTFSKD